MTDLTNVIDSPDRASVIAHMLLRLAPQPAPEPWPTYAEPVLAALLYAASPLDTGRGIDWVHAILTASAEQDLSAAVDAAGARGDARWLRRYDGLDERQRQCVIVTMCQAITPWLQRPHQEAS
ncbi:hypothetical protein [Mycolicibacterium chlorophenolicum]|uniref:Uncharacterized protein n=1 Tax=Mycolicibacterium chlorophenolicum TaxID=37916 RepID=A0A0J6VK26_9MYCO|nr:hypothetical protein [Mycolicibacterium chlorophenolicum]KMO69808.1 hypothetical protein MCHLDSM_05920 [Mycolicibacterium chlorophenolicum]